MPETTSAIRVPSPSERERGYFDDLVRARGDFNPFADRGWQTLARRFEAWVATGQRLDVLDVGCGTGQSRQLYIDHAGRYVGLDLSGEAIAIAQRRFPDSAWVAGDACDLPFPGGSFDVVAFSSVLHHIPDMRSALGEAARVLRQGGSAFAFDPNLLHPAMALFRHPRSPLYFAQGVSPDEKPLLPRVLREAFRSAGFTDLRQRGQSDIPYRYVAPVLLNAALSAYNACDWLWEKVGLGRWFGTFVVTCARK
jgi:ubiquinone/menaquinone biosynthesis C-methylase UbiE